MPGIRRKEKRHTEFDQRGRLLTTTAIMIVTITALTAIALSPFVVSAMDSEETDWERLSAIGQSYGAVSAILSAIAITGVALALALQSRQVGDARRFAVRQMHFDVLRMAVDNPRLMVAWGGSADNTTGDLEAYTTLVFNHYLFAYETGIAPLSELRLHLAEIFRNSHGREYWARGRHVWVTATTSQAGKRFIEAVEDEYQSSTPRWNA